MGGGGGGGGKTVICLWCSVGVSYVFIQEGGGAYLIFTHYSEYLLILVNEAFFTSLIIH